MPDIYNIETRAVRRVCEVIEKDYRLQANISARDKGVSWDGNVMVFSSNKQSTNDLLGKIDVQVKGVSVKELSKFQDLKRGNFHHFSLDVAHIQNYSRNGNITILFVVYFFEDESVCYYSLFLPSKTEFLLKQPIKTKKKSISITKYDEDSYAQFTFFYGLLHIEEKSQFHDLFDDITRDLMLNNWNIIVSNIQQGSINTSFIEGCKKLLEYLPEDNAIDEKAKENALFYSAIVLRRVINDFIESIYSLNEYIDATVNFYIIKSFYNEWKEQDIARIKSKSFFKNVIIPENKSWCQANFLYNLFFSSIIYLCWNIGAAINNMLYQYRSSFGEYRLVFPKPNSLTLYNCPQMLNGRKSAYLRLDFFGINPTYTPEKYILYSNIDELKQQLQNALSREN